MHRKSNSVKIIEWTRRLKRFRKSGLSVAQFCRQEHVSTATFYRWRQQIAQGEAKPKQTPKPEAGFELLRIEPGLATPQGPAVVAVLPGGVELHISSHGEILRSVLQELMAVANASSNLNAENLSS